MATMYDDLPIFPLPRLVFMPGSLLPLHVFEVRYQQLLAECLRTDGLVGIATLQPGFEASYGESPPIYPVFGVGKIIQAQQLPSGRSNIVIRHVQTVRLVREIPQIEDFRRVCASGQPLHTTGATAVVGQLRALLSRLGSLSQTPGSHVRSITELSDIELVDNLAARLIDTTDSRREYIALTSLAERAAVLLGQLGSVLSATSPSAEA